jgi:hypothetical protein
MGIIGIYFVMIFTRFPVRSYTAATLIFSVAFSVAAAIIVDELEQRRI